MHPENNHLKKINNSVADRCIGSDATKDAIVTTIVTNKIFLGESMSFLAKFPLLPPR